MEIKQQSAKSTTWIDRTGIPVPYNRVTAQEKQKEKFSFTLATEALKLNNSLCAFREKIDQMCMEVFEMTLTEKQIERGTKGNHTWYNFDGSIKIEVSIGDRIEFDTILIEQCKNLLLEVVRDGVSKSHAYLEGIILGAFQTTTGKLDTKRVMSLKTHAKRIPDERYHKAMELLDESICRTFLKKYFRVYLRNEHQEYEAIALDFSSF
ncbi:Protein of unknown function [Chitinophaga sp. YR573]|uniref:DUF3164 family protein n=1 Tax=Chitinophaga sp. YR573 TaxID=1881040 RepID=UPI0008D32A72|nr:DUF3164 family protein [Chitinophaga sp. YR573]SEW02217.1 Protein of unknown function [Chitinophaga sp. YR573]